MIEDFGHREREVLCGYSILVYPSKGVGIRLNEGERRSKPEGGRPVVVMTGCLSNKPAQVPSRLCVGVSVLAQQGSLVSVVIARSVDLRK